MWSERILHVDMDSFFVEVERRRDPGLVNRPVAVGGAGARGVVASASYQARAFGVRSGQPTVDALRLCPGLVVLPSNLRAYRDMSVRVFEVFEGFSPLVEAVGLDEAFVDVGGLSRHFRSAPAAGMAIREKVKTDLEMPCSVGVASNKFLAKLGSQAAKPDGLLHVRVDKVEEFLSSLPVSALWGVGSAPEAALAGLGMETVGDVAELPRSSLEHVLGPAQGARLFDLARGVDNRTVQPDPKVKSVSVEETYPRDLSGEDVIETAVLSHAYRLAGRLRRAGWLARTVNLKIRYADFTTFTRSQSLVQAVDTTRDLFAAARTLLETVEPDQPVRLIGLSGSSLEPRGLPRQTAIDTSEEWDRIGAAVADVLDRYGEGSVRPARLVNGKPDQTKNSEN